MALSVVQAVSLGNSGTAGATSVAPTISPVTVGHLVVCCVTGVSASSTITLSMTDSSAQTWASGVTAEGHDSLGVEHHDWVAPRDGRRVGQPNYLTTTIFYKLSSAAITTVTAKSAATCGLACTFFEIGGTDTSPVDVTAFAPATPLTAKNTAPTLTAGSATAQASEIAIGVIGTLSSTTGETIGSVTTGWNAETGRTGELSSTYWASQFAFYQILSSTATLTLGGTLGIAAYWSVAIMTFKSPAVAGGNPIVMLNSKRVGDLWAPVRKLWKPERRIFVPQLVAARAA
jgi:hypothetical protein